MFSQITDLTALPEIMYSGVGGPAMLQSGKNTLLRFGGNFSPQLIVGAKDVYIYTADGREPSRWWLLRLGSRIE